MPYNMLRRALLFHVDSEVYACVEAEHAQMHFQTWGANGLGIHCTCTVCMWRVHYCSVKSLAVFTSFCTVNARILIPSLYLYSSIHLLWLHMCIQCTIPVHSTLSALAQFNSCMHIVFCMHTVVCILYTCTLSVCILWVCGAQFNTCIHTALCIPASVYHVYSCIQW